jgi:hypothetical protein
MAVSGVPVTLVGSTVALDPTTPLPAGTNNIGTVSAQKPTTGAQSNVASSAASVTILASNANRLGATIYNDSTAVLYLLVAAGAASNSAYTVQLPGGALFEVPFNYTGIISGIWASATGNARVTEYT